MKITDVITLLGAIATFLFGMSTMTDGLQKLSSGRLEQIMEKLTNNIFKSVLVGALVTGLIHSSAATTVMCVGFVNSGIMKLEQTVGIIMGANIGTTVTSLILSLGDISSDNLFLTLMKPQSFGPIMAVTGVIFYLFLKGGKKKMIGQFCLGLGLLFIGMKSMEAAVAPLQELPQFQDLFVAFSNPFLGILVGTLVTALLQSSTASVGLLQAMTTTGAITFHVALPIILGQNIGTCITTVISSIGASKNAKRTAMLHLYFNVIGTLVFLVGAYGFYYIASASGSPPSFWLHQMSRGNIASIHTCFNIGCTVLLLPFHKQLVRLAVRTVPGDDGHSFALLDERFISSPSVALERAHDTVVQMGQFAQENYRLAVALLDHFDEKKLEQLNETECALDKLESLLDNYLVKLNNRALTSVENAKVSELLHTLSDFERIGDYSVNLSESASILHDRGLRFSDKAKRELSALTNAVDETIDRTVRCYESSSREQAIGVEPIEEVVDLMRDELRSRHIERLKTGECTIELGTQFLELLINLERISDHCSNIALYIVRETAPKDALIRTDAHAYMYALHHGDDKEFDIMFQRYRSKYYEPIA